MKWTLWVMMKWNYTVSWGKEPPPPRKFIFCTLKGTSVVAPVMKSFRPINSNLLTSVSSGPILTGESHISGEAKQPASSTQHHLFPGSPFLILQDERKARLLSQWGLFSKQMVCFVPIWFRWQVALRCQFPGAEIELPQQAFLVKAPINKTERRRCG